MPYAHQAGSTYLEYTFVVSNYCGWLKVSMEELRDLGLVDKISKLSYYDRKKECVWLHEDCDLMLFGEAKSKLNGYTDVGRWFDMFFDYRVKYRRVENTRITKLCSYPYRKNKIDIYSWRLL